MFVERATLKRARPSERLNKHTTTTIARVFWIGYLLGYHPHPHRKLISGGPIIKEWHCKITFGICISF